MNKKDYQKPTMQVVKLQQRQRILAGSLLQGRAGMQDYGWHDDKDGTGMRDYHWHNEQEE